MICLSFLLKIMLGDGDKKANLEEARAKWRTETASTAAQPPSDTGQRSGQRQSERAEGTQVRDRIIERWTMGGSH